MLYVARRYLHFTVDEWNALPWYVSRLYIEQLNEELTEGSGSPDQLNEGG